MADTNKGRKIFISTTVAGNAIPKEAAVDQTLANYQALFWTEVKNVGSIGQTGTDVNIVSYDELSTDVTQKQKGIANAGDPEIECARNAADPGQDAMRVASATKLYYAFKIEDADMPPAITHPTQYFMRGLVAGPTRPNGRNEDFNLEIYKLGLVQLEIVSDAV